MLKKERLIAILEQVNQRGIVTVNDLITILNVSDMTIRRDLDELAKDGKIIRIHGGAQSINAPTLTELSHIEKKKIHSIQKEAIAKQAASLIQENSTIYLGPGTTIELIAQYVHRTEGLRIVTNSLPVFKTWKNKDIELILIGGNYRKKSGAFIGSLTVDMLKQLKFNQAFVGINALRDQHLMTANPEEGLAQTIVLENSRKRIILADKFKIEQDDFYEFYNLTDIDMFVTNEIEDIEILEKYQKYTHVIEAKN